MELAEAVKAENNLLRDANSCAARSRSIDDPNYSEICKPSMGMEKQPLNSLEPYFTNEVECHTKGTGDAHTVSAQVEGLDHDGDDVSLLSLEGEAGQTHSTLNM